MDNRLTPARISLLYAVFAGLWIFASDKMMELAIPDPALLLQISLFKGFAFVLVTTWLLYQLMQTMVARTALSGNADAQSTGIFRVRKLLAIFLGLALIVPLFGYGIAKIYTPQIQQKTFEDLSAIADLKATQVETWLKERGDDADELAENRGFIDRTEQWLFHGDTKARSFIHGRLKALARLHNYDPVLLYADGRRAFSQDAAPDPVADDIWHELLKSARSSGKVQHSNLYRDNGGRIRLDYVIPLRLSNPQRTVGAVVLRAPVENFLFPLIQSWPTASPSAETVLARRDGNEALFLNELRHRKGTALKLRMPLDSHDLPIAVSIIDEKSQIMEGRDYRGVRVLATTRPIQGIDWHLVTKVDRDEVMALLYEMLVWVGLFAIIAVTVVASAVLMLWRQQQRLHHAELVARTAEKDKQLKLFYDLPFIGMAITSPDSKAWLYANDHLCEMLGYAREELEQTTWADLTHPDDLASNETLFERMTSGKIDGYTLEKRFLRKSGSPIIVNLDVKCTRRADGKVDRIVAMIEDITERKRAEESLRQAATVFESSHDGAIITDASGAILAANRSYMETTGYGETELLGQNPRILQSGRHSGDFYRQMWAGISHAGYWQGEIWNRRKNGEIYPERLSISAVKNARNETTNYVGITSDLSQIKQSEERMEHMAHYDPLTDLPNRLLILSHLTQVLARAQRHPHHVGVLYLDLDRFKNVNDSLGYPVGDELLIKLTERLTMHMRSEDMLARLGGDEFLLVLESIPSPEDAAVVARTILELLSQPFALSGEQEIFIGASIGISVYPNDGSNAAQLIQYADAAMHQAKEQGRNNYQFYTDALTRASSEHLKLETRLRHAITANQLRVCYQPQVDIATGHIIGAEALVRWQDPERGLIPPADFIPLAEETGLIDSIGEWVLKETCLQGGRWIETGLPFLTLAVNLSPHQFQRSNIVDMVSRVLTETGFPANRLELELTESALMEHEETAVEMLHLLRAKDIRLAIDDFGTGYSSLAYLKRFPLDILKIDKSFVDDIPFQQDDMEIAATIIAMGHSLGFKVLAEGVETQEQLSFLQTKGCDMYQGYLTSPPVPAEEFEELLKKNRGGIL